MIQSCYRRLVFKTCFPVKRFLQRHSQGVEGEASFYIYWMDSPECLFRVGDKANEGEEARPESAGVREGCAEWKVTRGLEEGTAD